MKPLLSHHDPRRTLRRHVEEVGRAAEAVLTLQGGAPWVGGWAGEVARRLSRLHDLGKGSEAFQRYIDDPGRWRGRPLDKAHTPLSMVLAVALGGVWSWSWEEVLAAALAVRGHHGKQPESLDRLCATLDQTDMVRAIQRQFASLSTRRLAQATGLDSLEEAASSLDPDDGFGSVWDELQEHGDTLRRAPPPDAEAFRFAARAAYSALLEADRAFLAVQQPDRYLERSRSSLPAERVDAFVAGLRSTPLDELRRRAGAEAGRGFAERDEGLLSLTLPTGAGKTLVAARWALAERQSGKIPDRAAPTVVVALPMLSIVDQTERVYRHLLDAPADGFHRVMASHSLSERGFDSEDGDNADELFLDTWRSEVVITTFDQLLLALFSDRPRHAMRYHRLLNARIVIDETQCLPTALWKPVSAALKQLTSLGRTRVLTMSATPPRCIDGAAEVIDDPSRLYRGLARYEIQPRHQRGTDLDRLACKCFNYMKEKKKFLFTVNTRRSAQELWQRLAERMEATGGQAPLLLSGDLTPSHRLQVIDALSRLRHGAVVSTQCVEAGVDLDVDHVVRDLAPLDALVQIAGRCNRHGLRGNPGTVEVVRLLGADGRDDASRVYHEVLLDCTERLLGDAQRIAESEVFDFAQNYFQQVAKSRDLGQRLLQRYVRLEGPLEVRALLRPEPVARRNVLVEEQDAGLANDLAAALAITGRWQRRRELRGLSARLSRVSVAVPEAALGRFALRTIGPFELLVPGQYHPVRGLDCR